MNRTELHRVVSLFDGIGVGWQSLKELGCTVEQAISFEIDRWAMQVCRKNHPGVTHAGSVVGADFRPYRGAELVMGGFPCTDLSIAKQGRKGLAGKHSSLFWELVRAIEEIQPTYFLVENNASMPKADKETITQTLGVEPISINSALVSGQSRKRLYWTNLTGITQPEDRGIRLADVLESGITEREKSLCITATYCHAGNVNDYLGRSKRQLIFDPVCVNSKSGRGNDPTAQPSLQDRIYHPSGKMPALTTSHRPNIVTPYDGIHPNVVTVRNGWAFYKGREYKLNLPDGEYTIRKLSPVECERLQTLDDGYTAGVSNTQRYKGIGNAWTNEVIKHIFSFRWGQIKTITA